MRWLADVPALAGFYLGLAGFPHGLRSLLETETAEVGVSAATVQKLARLTASGRLPPLAEGSLAAMLEGHGFAPVPLDAATAEQAARLPPRHDDPFDRALIATAQRTGAVVLTDRPAVAAYGVPCRWDDA